jgi:hypothetical protein
MTGKKAGKTKLAVTAAVAIALAAAGKASAGVVITQEQVITNRSGEVKSEQTVMIEGHKRKLVDANTNTVVITDLDVGAIYYMNPATRQILSARLPPVGMFQMMLAREGLAADLKKTAGTDKVAGYECREYQGSVQVAHSEIEVSRCVAKDAPGAEQYVEFEKAMQQKVKGTLLESKGETPDGITVSSKVVGSPLPFAAPAGGAPEQASRFKAAMAKMKPIITTVTVSKIEVKELAADIFVVPAGYSNAGRGRRGTSAGAGPATPDAAASPGAAAVAPTPASH